MKPVQDQRVTMGHWLILGSLAALAITSCGSTHRTSTASNPVTTKASTVASSTAPASAATKPAPPAVSPAQVAEVGAAAGHLSHGCSSTTPSDVAALIRGYKKLGPSAGFELQGTQTSMLDLLALAIPELQQCAPGEATELARATGQTGLLSASSSGSGTSSAPALSQVASGQAIGSFNSASASGSTANPSQIQVRATSTPPQRITISWDLVCDMPSGNTKGQSSQASIQLPGKITFSVPTEPGGTAGPLGPQSCIVSADGQLGASGGKLHVSIYAG